MSVCPILTSGILPMKAVLNVADRALGLIMTQPLPILVLEMTITESLGEHRWPAHSVEVNFERLISLRVLTD